MIQTFLGSVLAVLLAIPASVPQSAPWWNPAWARRRAVSVTVGANTPQDGYAGYTVRLSALDTAAMIAAGDLLASGDDLRIVRWDGAAWTDLPRHLLALNSAATDVRFALAAPVAASAVDGSYYLYYRNPAAGAPPAMTTTNVYRWFDDGSADRLSSYTNGRVHASGPSNGLTTPSSIAYNAAAGAYEVNTTDNFSESLRPTGVTERDVLVTYDLYQTGAYGLNMLSGPLVRLTTDGGAPAAENAGGFYLYMLCDSGANPGAPYAGHGDIAQNAIQNGGGLVDGSASAIGQVTINAWHSVGLAAWGAGPTALKSWTVNAPSATSLGLFGAPASLTGSQATGDTTSTGAAGLYFFQDISRFRNLLVRRYVEPEPVSALGGVEDGNGGGGGAGAVAATSGGGGDDGHCGCGVSGLPGRAAFFAAVFCVIGAFLRCNRGG
jgi:hypothetical protein